MRHRFRFASPTGPFAADDLYLSPSAVALEGPDVPSFVTRLLGELRAGTPLVEELRLAVSDDERDGVRFALTLLGAMAFASRAGCRPAQVRRFAESFVQTTLEGVRDAAVVEECALRAVGVVDTLYLLHGARAFGGDMGMLADVAAMLEGEPVH